MEIICAECGQPVVRTSNAQKRCPPCQAAARKIKQRDAKRKSDLAKKQVTFVCEGCGEIFPKTLDRQRICPTCKATRKTARNTKRVRAWRRKSSEANPDRTRFFICCDCHRKFPRKTPGSRQKRCDPCRQKHSVNDSRKRQTTRRKTDPDYKEKAALYAKARRADSPMVQLNAIVSCSIYHSLNGKKDGRHWEHLVGYTRLELARHLERQFTRGMSWSNVGKWHIDHIRPISSFKFTSYEDEDFRHCWALSNLRPLWGKTNQYKGSKVTLLL